MSETLLRTKLFVPPLRPNLIPRPHLVQQLNHGLEQGHKLTLISAPAGFGKTTLVTEWVNSLRSNTRPDHPTIDKIAWLSLDEDDNDPARFMTYFIAALNHVQADAPAVGKEAHEMLQSPQPLPTESILTSLINDTTAVPTKIALVLDDYHQISAPAVEEAVAFFLDHLPAQIHLIVATRSDPSLPVARHRVRGELTELRAADLHPRVIIRRQA